MLLKELHLKAPNCVFKGGTSLSKCFNVIDRFSEDIDITFNHILNQSQRKNLKNKTIAEISN
ncbi:nucleotidyl transferase AbiEii/AbiGii toxin family protein, partial [Klebsiella pneumoniae]|uniref:nucleotidyl transferase AbiEii/AbiGii toxin family protein n=1 Tax=Klebsiella pneumoniae TaxID=573 RepID=UPI0025A16988